MIRLLFFLQESPEVKSWDWRYIAGGVLVIGIFYADKIYRLIKGGREHDRDEKEKEIERQVKPIKDEAAAQARLAAVYLQEKDQAEKELQRVEAERDDTVRENIRLRTAEREANKEADRLQQLLFEVKGAQQSMEERVKSLEQSKDK